MSDGNVQPEEVVAMALVVVKALGGRGEDKYERVYADKRIRMRVGTFDIRVSINVGDEWTPVFAGIPRTAYTRTYRYNRGLWVEHLRELYSQAKELENGDVGEDVPLDVLGSYDLIDDARLFPEFGGTESPESTTSS